MKLILLFFISFAIGPGIYAQGSWKVNLNGKTVLNIGSEDEKNNLIVISPNDLKNKNSFCVTFIEKNKKEDWERTITAYGTKGTDPLEQKGNKFKIKNSRLQSLFKGTDRVEIYTISLPTDPDLRARVRVRRVHLCTLVLKQGS